MAITRTVIVDDDGSGTTGTIWNNAWKTEFYDQIDGVTGGIVQTTTLTGTQNDFALSAGAAQLRANNATLVTLTGLAAGSAGQRLVILSVGAGAVALNDQDAGSTAANRIITGTAAPITLAAGTGWAVLSYDGTAARWKVTGSSAAIAESAVTNLVADLAAKAPLVPRVTGTTSSATPTPNADTTDLYSLTAQAAAAAFANPTGTPVNGQKLLIRIKDNATARALTWGTAYVAGGVALPSTTVISKILTIGLIYSTDNTLNKWQCVAVAQEA
jgi:hypothetical protein